MTTAATQAHNGANAWSTARNSTPFLQIRGLCKQFGGIQALRDIDLDIYPGEVLGLLGDNGAGKSTLIKSISGVYIPTSGTMQCEGKSVSISSPNVARSLGIETVFQDLALIPNLDAAANLFIGREIGWFKGLLRVMNQRAMLEDVKKTLDQLDIHIPSLRLDVEGFSGGQRQAIAIARAIRWKAKLVILDEPTAALSVPEQRKVLALTRQLASQGVAVIYITHNILDVIAVTDRLAILHRGRKAAEIATKDCDEHEIVSLIMGKSKPSI
ncbi:ATP-binding cassette domain-containing protein [Labrys wisconsinensis]|uniref:ABC-type sugar transport system ATPase subunit n=1 Tax=Labrys wisconsinensis TaxID=425677 RepID=A0ABU0JCC8_9HYPH|nr:ATP-binding cassette domain-containing protein [Labrys wisconsinensis]MDQ0471939.1 ABC-type sugar transport system ATPase subunit [Labrys wisconsinensis]